VIVRVLLLARRCGRRKRPGSVAARAQTAHSQRALDTNRRARLRVFVVLLLAALICARPAFGEGLGTVLISGRGYGHGVGLSQYGAQGYARHGWGYREILRHYYPGTAFARAANETVRVLVDDAQSAVRISSQSGLRLTDARGGTLLLPAGEYLLDRGMELSVAGQRYRPQPPLRFDGIQAPLMVNGVGYRGSLIVGAEAEGLYVVNELAVDEYVRGVVSWEMPASWLPQALRAQAVAARSYALAERKPGRLFDLYPDTRSQMYGGIRAETAATDAAVRATAGEVLTWHQRIAYTFFSSTSGGCTAALGDGMPGAQSLPYLVSVPDPYDGIAPEHAWGPLAIPAARLEALFGLAPINAIHLQRNGSGRVALVVFDTSSGSHSVGGETFARALGLRSTWFAVSLPGEQAIGLGGCSAHGQVAPLPPPAPAAARAPQTNMLVHNPQPRQLHTEQAAPAAKPLHSQPLRRLRPLLIAFLLVLAAALSTIAIGSAFSWDVRALAVLAVTATVASVAVRDWLRPLPRPPVAAGIAPTSPARAGPPVAPSTNASPPAARTPSPPPLSQRTPGTGLPRLPTSPSVAPPPTHPLAPLPAAPVHAGITYGPAPPTGKQQPRSQPTHTGKGSTPPVPPVSPLPAPPGPLEINAVHVTADPATRALSVSWQTSLPATTRGASGFSKPTLWTTADTAATTHETTFMNLAPASSYHLSLEAIDAWGRVQTTSFDAKTPALPTAPNLQANGTALWLDAQPFFPVAVWAPCVDTVNTSLTEGINTFMGDACDTAAALSQQIGARALAIVDPTSGDEATNVVGWYYPDEWDARLPDSPSPALLEQAARGSDNQLSFLTLTNHFFSGAAPLPQGRDMYPILAATARVLGFDLYPLQSWCSNDAFAAVYDAQRELVQLAAGKPTYQWIETGAMEHCPQPELAPTPETVRAETWLAIAGGATGIGYFPGTWTSQIGNEISQSDNEIKELTPALLAGQTQASAGDPSIKLSARELNGALYLIAVNASRNPVTTTIQLPGLAGRTLQVYDENRTLTTVGDSLSDAFEPLQVHIYIAAPPLSPTTPSDGQPMTNPGSVSSNGDCDCGLQFK
jgi:stage II sporulation protein D